MAIGEIVEPREIVKANNELFRCQFKIKDIVAGRIFMAFASLVDHKDVKENDNFVEYKISASSIMQGIDAGGDYFEQLFDAAESLVKHTIKQRKYNDEFVTYSLFSKIHYKNKIITGQLHKDLIPFFVIARERFTKIKLEEYMQLPSIYSQALFGFLKSWSDRNEVNISVAELNSMLGTPDSFRRNFTDFRRWVLDKAHKDINTLTSLKYDWEAVKVGRSYKEIKFIFHKEIKQRSRQPLTQSTLPDPSAPVQNTVSVAFAHFFQKFPNPGIFDVRSRAWKIWDELHESGNAPLADDVPDDNALSVIEFLTQWRDSHK